MDETFFSGGMTAAGTPFAGLPCVLILGAYALCFAVRQWERGGFREMREGVRRVATGGPLWFRAAMAALFLSCTIDAQKPGNAGGGGTNTSPAAVQSQGGGGGPQPLPDGAPAQRRVRETAAPDGAPGFPPEMQAASGASGAPDAPDAPPRVVFQATLAPNPEAVPVFAGEPGWEAPAALPVTPKLSALSFAGEGPDVPSPVCFTNFPGVAVHAVILVTRGGAADLATLVDAPEPARLRFAPAGWPAPAMTASERALTERFVPGQWQATGVDLDRLVPLEALFFGGSAGRPEWRRNWRGEIAEIVCFDAPPGGDLAAGVAHYLALRWGIAGVPPATPAQRAAAVNAGLRRGLAWSSLFFIK
jgi:hypothetical protein